MARQTRERDKKLGEILVEQGAISQPELERYMRVQIEEAVYYLFTWTQGTFNFEADVRPERQDFLVSINPESLLLEGARRVDEWSLIEKKIPSFDLIFIVDHERLDISEATLTETQQRILPLLDGSRDVNQIIEDSGLGEFEVGKALYGLITAGFLHRAGRTTSAESGKASDARVEEHRNLGRRLLQDGDAGRGGARVPAGGRAARRRRRRPLLPRSRGAAAGALAGSDGVAAPRGREGREPARGAAQPRASPTSSWAGWTRPRPRAPKRRRARAPTPASISAGASSR